MSVGGRPDPDADYERRVDVEGLWPRQTVAVSYESNNPDADRQHKSGPVSGRQSGFAGTEMSAVLVDITEAPLREYYITEDGGVYSGRSGRGNRGLVQKIGSEATITPNTDDDVPPCSICGGENTKWCMIGTTIWLNARPSFWQCHPLCASCDRKQEQLNDQLMGGSEDEALARRFTRLLDEKAAIPSDDIRSPASPYTEDDFE